MKNYCFDLQAFLAEMGPGVKLVFLCNPNNPTGTYLNRLEIEGFLNQVPQTCIVVLDEAYAEFADAEDFPDSTQLVRRYPNLLVCRTFSKIYGMGGIRLGYAMAGERLIQVLKKVRNFNPFNVNRAAQAGALAALRDRDFFLKSRETNLEGRAFITSELGKMGIDCLPSQANFLCFRTRLSGNRLVEGLLQEGVIIRSLESFGMPEWCRVTVGTPRQNAIFLKALQHYLKQAG
jgi:histidinol-phosphate aminotransferase